VVTYRLFFSSFGKILLIPIICISCIYITDNQGRKPDNGIVLDIDELITEELVYFSELFTDFHIITLETDTNSLFSVISNMKLVGDTLFIFDRIKTKSVYIFNNEGYLINKVSKIGRGPGEYTQVSDFEIDTEEKSIYILDWPSKKMNIYDYKTNFIKSITLADRFSSFTVSKPGYYLYRPHPSTTAEKDIFLLYFYNKKGKSVWGKFLYSDTLSGPQRTEFHQGGNFFKSVSGIKFFRNFGTIIYTVDGNKVSPFLTLFSEKFKMTKNDFEAIDQNRPSLYLQARGKLQKLTGISGYSENREIAFIKFYIGWKEYKLFYTFRTGKTICSSNFVDDLTFINPSLFKVNNTQIIAYIDPSQIAKLKEIVFSGTIKTEYAIRERLQNLSEYSNPVIILYDLK
jgi:hypothetical protein